MLKILLDLYITFFKIGAVTFGGGYAMLPVLDRELAQKKKWVTGDDLLDYYAVSQVTPGVIAVNVSTFVGSKKAGCLGGVAATAGVVSPSVIIITIIALFISSFEEIVWVQKALAGVNVAVTALLSYAGFNFARKSIKNWWGVLIYIASFCAVFFYKIPSVAVVLFALAVGLAIHFVCAGLGKGTGGLADRADGSADRADGSAEEAGGLTDEAPGSTEESSGSANKAAGSAKASTGSANKAAGFAKEAPSSAEETPGSANKTGGSANKTDGSAEEAPGSADDAPGSTEDAPGSAEEAYGSPEEASGSPEAAPGSEKDAPGSANKAAGSANDASGSTEATPASEKAAPASPKSTKSIPRR